MAHDSDAIARQDSVPVLEVGTGGESCPTVISLRGVRVHNLDGIDVEVPLRRLTVVTGVSGAGKSSLAFDTFYAEAQRRYLQSFSAYTRQFLERLDQPEADHIGDLPPAIAVGARSLPRGLRATVGTLTEIVDYLRLLFSRAGTVYCQQCGGEVKAQSSRDVQQAIQELPDGTRVTLAFPVGRIGNPSHGESPLAGEEWLDLLKEEGFLRVQVGSTVYRLDQPLPPELTAADKIWVLVDRLETGKVAAERLHDSLETCFARGHGRMALIVGDQPTVFDQRLVCPACDLAYPALEPRLFNWNDPLGACPACEGTGRQGKELCVSCGGSRLGEFAGCVRLAGKHLGQTCTLTIAELMDFFRSLEIRRKDAAAEPMLLDQIRRRLEYLRGVELGYLSLDRLAATLSSGEARRIRLATALGSNLVDALYVFDEPTVGLHPRDTRKVWAELVRLRDAGNTLVVVEHDLELVLTADHVIDLGPGAGEEGGQVVYQGEPSGLKSCAESETGAFLSGRRLIAVPRRRRSPSHGHIRITGARAHNLQNLTVDFPLGILCVVTGVSGSGKSTLVQETLYPALCRRKNKKVPDAAGAAAEVQGAGQIGDVVLVDQEPLARTARSNPATYLKVFDEIRQVFADTAEAKIRNFGPAAFSFNQAGGRCETCQGQGTLTVDMQFLADVTMTCPECLGSRFKKDILQVKVRNLSIAEVLNLTVREAFRFFRAQPKIERRLKYLLDVGLDYLRLGQATDTLSGGEAQRLKLAGHLGSSRKPRCLFLLDEPTAGLHNADIVRLLDCFDRLLETGHSLILVEHHLDMIKCADWVIDLGPGGGPEGGRVVAAGTPENVAGVGASAMGECLRELLTRLSSPAAEPRET